MKRYFLLLVLSALLVVPSRAQDFERLSERSIMGTARYVGFGGAMSAIGGDPSAVNDNPAGLGLYRRSEVLITGDYMRDQTLQPGNTDAQAKQVRHFVIVPQASWVICLPTANEDRGVLSHNIMLSYNRKNSFIRSMRAGMGADYSLGGLFAATGKDLKIPYNTADMVLGHDIILQESGYWNEYGLDWAMNISNKWYFGAGLRVQSYSMTSDGDYYEAFESQTQGVNEYYNQNVTYLHFSGVSCSLTAGAIYRPTSWLRLGFSIHTPTIGSLTTFSDGKLIAQTDTLCSVLAPHGGGYNSGDFHLPLHTSTSVAFQIGYYGLLSMQYDYFHQLGGAPDIHSLRTGLEVIPIPGMYINAGYAYESSFRKEDTVTPIDPALNRFDAYSMCPQWSQYASVALGYRGKYAIVQVAYQYRWQNLHLYAHQDAFPYDIQTNTHRVVLTLGWHRY